jgi:membrane protein required for colicin V production
VLLVSVLVGLFRGLVFEVLSIAGWVVAYLVASPMAPWVAQWLPADRMNPALLHVVSLAVAFALVLLVWGLAARLLKSLIQASPLSVLDRLAGAGFGALRGVVLSLLMVWVASFTPLAESATWHDSRVAPWLQTLLVDLKPLMPEAAARLVRGPAASAPDSEAEDEPTEPPAATTK